MRRIKFEVENSEIKVGNSKNTVDNSNNTVGNSTAQVCDIRSILCLLFVYYLVIQLRRFAILGPYYASCLYITVNIPSNLNDNVT